MTTTKTLSVPTLDLTALMSVATPVAAHKASETFGDRFVSSGLMSAVRTLPQFTEQCDAIGKNGPGAKAGATNRIIRIVEVLLNQPNRSLQANDISDKLMADLAAMITNAHTAAAAAAAADVVKPAKPAK